MDRALTRSSLSPAPFPAHAQTISGTTGGWVRALVNRSGSTYNADGDPENEAHRPRAHRREVTAQEGRLHEVIFLCETHGSSSNTLSSSAGTPVLLLLSLSLSSPDRVNNNDQSTMSLQCTALQLK